MKTADKANAETQDILEVLAHQKWAIVHLLKQQQEVAERRGPNSTEWAGVKFLEGEVERLADMMIDCERRLGLR